MKDWTPRERHAFAAGFAYALACAAHGARPEQLPAYLNAMTASLKLDYGLLLEILEGARAYLGASGSWRCPSRSRDINEGGRANHVDPGVRRR